VLLGLHTADLSRLRRCESSPSTNNIVLLSVTSALSSILAPNRPLRLSRPTVLGVESTTSSSSLGTPALDSAEAGLVKGKPEPRRGHEAEAESRSNPLPTGLALDHKLGMAGRNRRPGGAVELLSPWNSYSTEQSLGSQPSGSPLEYSPVDSWRHALPDPRTQRGRENKERVHFDGLQNASLETART
jgi:hypothetical protein